MLRGRAIRVWMYSLIIVLLVIIGLAAWWLGAFGSSVTIVAARAEQRNEASFIVYLDVEKSGMDSVVRHGSYARALLFSCDNEDDYYPIDWTLDGIPHDDFAALSRRLELERGSAVPLSFSVPRHISDQFSFKCVRLSGGNMLGLGNISSNIARVQ